MDDEEIHVIISGKQSAQIIAALCMAGMNGIFPHQEIWGMVDKLVEARPDGPPIRLFPVPEGDDFNGD